MESRTIYLAKYLNEKRSEFDDYLDEKILIDDQSLIRFLTKTLLLFSSFLAIFSLDNSISEIITCISLLTFSSYSILKILQTRKAYYKFRRKSFLGCQIKTFNQNFLHLEILTEDVIDFKRLIKGSSIENKINIIATNKSKTAANHFMLFTVLDYIAVNGIKYIERKKLLVIINNHFLIAGVPMKEGTFFAQYSKWMNEEDEKKLDERKSLIRKVFQSQ